MTNTILVIEQEPNLSLFADAFAAEDVDLCLCGSVDQGVQAAEQSRCALVFLSTALCDAEPGKVIAALRDRVPNVPVYLVCAPDEAVAVDGGHWFEVVRAPLRPDALRCIGASVLRGEPSRVFKLYVTGSGAYAKTRADRVRGMLDGFRDGDYVLEVVDILREPERARLDQVRATPTLVRVGRMPRRQVLGVDDARIASLLEPADVKW